MRPPLKAPFIQRIIGPLIARYIHRYGPNIVTAGDPEPTDDATSFPLAVR